MSLILMAKALKHKTGNSLKKLVLLKICDNADDDTGLCWPSAGNIAAHCEMSKSTVRKYINDLVEDGVLVKQARKKGKMNQSNLYKVVEKKLKDNIKDKPKGMPSDDICMPSDDIGVCRDTAPEPIIKKPIKESTNALSRFREFWDLYDKKVDRAKCERKWKRITEKQKNKIFEVLPNYIKQTPDKQYRKNPHTWLNGQCWEDEDIQQADPDKPQARLYDGKTAKEWQDLGIELGIGEYEGIAVEPFGAYIQKVKGKL